MIVNEKKVLYEQEGKNEKAAIKGVGLEDEDLTHGLIVFY